MSQHRSVEPQFCFVSYISLSFLFHLNFKGASIPVYMKSKLYRWNWLLLDFTFAVLHPRRRRGHRLSLIQKTPMMKAPRKLRHWSPTESTLTYGAKIRHSLRLTDCRRSCSGSVYCGLDRGQIQRPVCLNRLWQYGASPLRSFGTVHELLIEFQNLFLVYRQWKSMAQLLNRKWGNICTTVSCADTKLSVIWSSCPDKLLGCFTTLYICYILIGLWIKRRHPNLTLPEL